MATLYCDFENGNDNHGGTSFALLAQGTDGRITSTTFSSATASFPNDGSLIGQYLSIFNGSIQAVYNITAWVSSTSLTIAAISGGTALANQAVDRQYYIGGRWKSFATGATAVRTIPGDTIRVMGSPAPTSLGQNGVWTSQIQQATKNITSSTNATPISITSTNHGYSTGDTVVITGHTTNTNANGTWEITSTGANTFTLNDSAGNGVGGTTGTVRLRNNTRVMLTTAVTQNIASTGPGRANWVSADGANVTIARNVSFFKENVSSDSISPAAAFTTGKAAYYVLPSTLDLSGYQQVSFWIFCTTTLTAGQVELRLCSDATGDTTVNTISVPAVPGSNRYQAVTVDTGAALGASIASISLNVNTDLSTTATVTILLNNIIACKASSAADSLTLTSLIGKNTTGETFWGIQSINGTRVMLDATTNNTPTDTAPRGYYGTSGTVTTWKRETIKSGPVAAGTIFQTLQEVGTLGNPITYSGGWDRTNMSTQNIETWVDGLNGNGTFLSSGVGFSYINMEKFALARLTSFDGGVNSITFCNFDIIAINNSSGSALGTSSNGVYRNTYTLRSACANGGSGLSLSSGNSNTYIVGNILSNSSNAILASPGATIKALAGSGLLANSNGAAVSAFPAYMEGITTRDNISGGINASLLNCDARMVNCVVDDTIEFSLSSGASNYIFSHNHDNVLGNHKIFTSGGLISAATDQRNTASGISWKMQPTATVDRNSLAPLVLSLAKVACAANSLVTIKAWMRRDNAGLTMRLVCKGGQLAGVANDVTASVTTTNAWEEETITFTPTETGVVEITAEVFGGTTFSGWVDDLTISQA